MPVRIDNTETVFFVLFACKLLSLAGHEGPMLSASQFVDCDQSDEVIKREDNSLKRTM